MKKIIVTILLVVNGAASMLVAQSYIQLNNFWENTYFINPAAMNDQYLSELKMAARQQWFALDGAPTTYFGSATLYSDEMNAQFGLKILQDKIGYSSVTNLDLTYAYAIQLKWDVQLHFGLALNYQSLTNDITKLQTEAFDKNIYGPLSKSDIGDNFNAGVGAELTSRYWRLGVSSQNVASLLLPRKGLFLNSNFAYAMFRDYTNNYVNLGFGLCGVQVGNINQLQVTATSYFSFDGQMNPFKAGGVKKSSEFQLGIFYRTMSEIGAVLGVDLGRNLFAAYSFDYNLGGISRSSFGTHEIMFTYRINKLKVCHHCWN